MDLRRCGHILCNKYSKRDVFLYQAVARNSDRWLFHAQNTANQGNNSSTSSAIVTAAIQRARKSLVTDHFVPRKSHPRNSDFEPATAAKVFITKVLLQQNASDVTNTFKPLDGSIDESYTLTVLLAGTATITSISSIGILYGLETLTQLFYTHTAGGIYTPFAPVLITDAPQFVHRGLNMDVSRNYYAPSDIMRTIDALSWNKFNRLHLHVTDAQSWPLVISALPDLATKGAYGAGLWYNPQELADIQEYGMYRGVEVNLEIDMPGHTASVRISSCIFSSLLCNIFVHMDYRLDRTSLP